MFVPLYTENIVKPSSKVFFGHGRTSISCKDVLLPTWVYLCYFEVALSKSVCVSSIFFHAVSIHFPKTTGPTKPQKNMESRGNSSNPQVFEFPLLIRSDFILPMLKKAGLSPRRRLSKLSRHLGCSIYGTGRSVTSHHFG